MQSAQASEATRPRVRRAFVLTHRYVGLFIAFFLIIAGVTGTIIAFYEELDRALNPELFRVVERGNALDADALAARVRWAYPEAFINLLALDREPGESVRVRLTPLNNEATGKAYELAFSEIFVDPFDGRVLGGRNRGEFHADRPHLMPFLYKLHYTLYVPGKWGEWFMGIVALVWMFDCFVGFYVTLPQRRATSAATTAAPAPAKSWWQRWQPAWKIKRSASATRLNFDLHRANGLWFWVVLFVLAFTSVYFNLTTEVFRPVLGSIATLSPPTGDVLSRLENARTPVRLGFEDAIVAARAQLSPASRDMVPSYVGLNTDAPGIYRVRFADVDRGDRNWHFHHETLYIDGMTGKLALRAGHHVGTAADKFMLWQYPLHSGQLLGFWGRVFMAIVGLVTALVSVTGVVIWLKKRRVEAVRAASPVRGAGSLSLARGRT